MAKLKRRDFDRISETLAGHGATMVTIRRELERLPLSPEVDRLEALLGGVRVALERMGGNVLPSFQAEVTGLKAEMNQFSAALFRYHLDLTRLLRHLEVLAPVAAECAESEVPQRSTQGQSRKKRKYTKKSKPEVEISSVGAASHNDMDEEEPVKP
jgi:hypothetical protein